MPDFRAICAWGAMVLFLMGAAHSVAQTGPDDAVGAEARKADVAFLDSLLGPRMTASIQDAAGLAARNALVEMMLKAGDVQCLEWALAVHGWLRAAGDAHMRVPFDRFTAARTDVPAPDPLELLDPEGLWSRFGPGESVAPSARAAWLARTWSWVGVLGANGEEADVAPSVQAVSSGMTIEDHGAFQRWVIPSFGSGSDRQFVRSFRRCVRRLRRAGLPVMVDLRGNLGGYRTRRHAILGVFASPSAWPEEREGAWSMAGRFDVVPAMPIARVRRVIDAPVAVMLDGLSFSASLLLADALEHSVGAGVFGCAPLGLHAGCSGNPEPVLLPGSGIEVLIPKRQTKLGSAPSAPFALPDDAGCDSAGAEWNRAVLWLLSADLEQAR
ncbi:MAG: hypothetical protein ACPGGB_02790 [Flavobacteriales bacterium]